MKKNRTILLILMCGLLWWPGCDQIPFISKYFPSLQEKKTEKKDTPKFSSQPAPAVTMRPDTLIRVGNWTMSVNEFNQRLSDLKELVPELDSQDPEAKELILEELVRQQLLVQDAERRGIGKDKDIVDAVEEFRQTLLIQEVVGDITQDIEVTDLEVRQFYENNKDSFAEPSQWRIREILVSSQNKANEILIELLKGADFAQMARDNSMAQSAKDGGDLGYVEEFKFPQMENAVMSLEEAGISSVFKGPDGYYIVKLVDKKGGKPQDFAQMRDDIKAGLEMMKQQQAVLNYIDSLREKITVEVNRQLLEK